MHKSITAKRWDNPRLAKQAVAKKATNIEQVFISNFILVIMTKQIWLNYNIHVNDIHIN